MTRALEGVVVLGVALEILGATGTFGVATTVIQMRTETAPVRMTKSEVVGIPHAMRMVILELETEGGITTEGSATLKNVEMRFVLKITRFGTVTRIM